MTAPAAPAPGYYTDPLDPEAERWWDGAGWTESIRPAETASEVPSGGSSAVDSGVDDDPESDMLVPRLADVEAGEIPQLAPSPIELAPRASVTRPESRPATAAATPVPAVEVAPLLEAAPEVAPTPQPQPQPQPAPEAAGAIAAGYYPDPYGQAPMRWWDGRQWTTATSQPEAPTHATAPAATPATPAATPAHERPAEDAPRPAHDAYRGGVRPTRSGSSTVLPVRGGGRGDGVTSTLRRVGLPGLAAVLVLAVALGVRLFVLDTEPAAAAQARLAASINLRAGDLPAGWKAVAEPADDAAPASAAPRSATPANRAGATSGTPAPAGKPADPMAGFDRDIARCIGGADPTTSVAFTSESPSWSRGSSEISSEVVVLHSAALAQQDLRARQGKSVDACMRRVGVPAMKAALAPSGVVLTGLAVQRLPGAAPDAYALRLKMTAQVQGRPLTVWTDTYGFVHGNTEVGLTVASVGATPDRAVAAEALRQLRARATTTT